MLPWNPPSSFSLGSDSQQPRYPPYGGNGGGAQESPLPHQQPQQSPQQQHQPLSSNGGPPAPPSSVGAASTPAGPYPPMTLAATLHFLQSEHRRYARDRNEWEIERAEMRARIALLEGEKRGNEGALKSLGRRCKMLEMALRGERSKFLSTTNALASGASLAPSGTASPVPGVPSAASGKDATLAATGGTSAIPPAKLAALQTEAGGGIPSAPGTPGEGPTSTKVGSLPMQSSTSSPGQAAAPLPKTEGGNAGKSETNGFQTGTWGGTMGGVGGVGSLGGRDPRGKARSREYLKQCLQEITYLTSSTTLNPLSAHSYAAPSVPRPRKSLPDHVPPPGAPGVINLPAGSAQTGEVPPLAEMATAPSTAPTAPSTLPPPASSAGTALPLESSITPPPPSILQQQQQTKQASLLTSFPSDPPSAFVPLKRQISQPGQQGGVRGGASSSVRGGSAATAERVEEEKKVDAEKQDAGAPTENEMDRAIAEFATQQPKDVEDLPEPEPLVADEAAVVNAAPGAAVEKAAPSAVEDAQQENFATEEVRSVAPEEDKLEEQSLLTEDEALEKAQEVAPETNDEMPSEEDVAVTPSASLATDEEAAEEKVEEEVAEEVQDEAPDGALEPVADSSTSATSSATAEASVDPKAEDVRVEEADKAEGEVIQAEEHADTKNEVAEPLSSSANNKLNSNDLNRGGEAATASNNGGKGGNGRRGEGGEGGEGDLGLSGEEGEEQEVVTAIFRPESEEAWRAKLKEAGRRAYPSLLPGGGGGGDKELEGLEWDLGDAVKEEEGSSEEGSVGRKKGKKGKKGAKGKRQAGSEETVGLKEGERFVPRRVLKSHLEAVRVVEVLEGDSGFEVVSAGDDFTVKLWRDAVGKSGSRSDLEPTITYRGHTAPITALTVLPASCSSAVNGATVFSASLDSTIRIWRVPPPSHNIYDPVDPSPVLSTLDTNADAVWGLALFGGGDRLAAITADGSIQVWDWQRGVLVKAWTYGAPESVDTPLSPIKAGSLKKRPSPPSAPTALTVFKGEIEEGKGEKEYLVVGFQNAVVKVFEPEQGREVRRIAADETSVFDLKTGTCLVSTAAHLDGVTALVFSPSSANAALLASTSHDASFRLWQLSFSPETSASASLICVQEASTHRVKSAEGVLDVAFSANGDVAVTAGADGTVRVWEK
ncbi:hypothetical protein JCM11251_003494 [Rhodosporidiobolus azoricus]